MAKTATQAAKIRAAYAKVEELEKEIHNAEVGNYSTDGIFRFSTTGQPVDIRTVTGEEKLKEIYSFLLQRESYDVKAAEELGLTSEAKWLSAPIAVWKTDLKTRVTKMKLASRKAELAEYKRTLVSMDPSFKTELQLDSILGKL